MLTVVIEKLLEWMPISLPFLRSPQCVIPTNISDKEKKGRCTNYFQRLVLYLSGNSIITAAVSPKAFQEYSVFISAGKEIEKCSKFDRKKEYMDDFHFKKFDMDDSYWNSAIVLKLVFVLINGQGS